MSVMFNLNNLECCVCEGIFAAGEKIIEEDGELFCESCYESESDTGEIY